MKTTKEKLESRLRRLVEVHVTTRKDQVDALIDRLAAGDFFFTPASTTPNYHMATYGGLAMHSINFIQAMIGLVELMQEQISTGHVGWGASLFSDQDRKAKDCESAVIIGLCHDLNKTTQFGKGYYRPNILKNGEKSDSKPYERISRFRLGGNLESLTLASRYIDLYPEEAQAIAWCEGLYNRQFTTEVPEPHYLTHLAHMADMMTSHIIERKEEPARMDRTLGQFEDDLNREKPTRVTLASANDTEF